MEWNEKSQRTPCLRRGLRDKDVSDRKSKRISEVEERDDMKSSGYKKLELVKGKINFGVWKGMHSKWENDKELAYIRSEKIDQESISKTSRLWESHILVITLCFHI